MLQRLVLPLIVEEIVQVVQICQSSVIEVIVLCASLVVVRPAHVVVFGVVGLPWENPQAVRGCREFKALQCALTRHETACESRVKNQRNMQQRVSTLHLTAAMIKTWDTKKRNPT